MKEINILDIEGFFIGQAEKGSDNVKTTGCTAIICKGGATAGVSVRGGAPASRETKLLDPKNLVEKIHAVSLSGGSAYGLACADGIMSYLEEKNIGFDVGVCVVPIVCGASLFDLTFGDCKIRPDHALGYEACVDSENNSSFKQGNYGAGCGSTVGKILGADRSMKSGIGAYALQIGDLKVGAIVAVNALGSVFDYNNGEILAGVLSEDKKTMLKTTDIMFDENFGNNIGFTTNTTIGTIITNANLTKSQCSKVSDMAHNGYAKTINPVHTTSDGDTIFTMAFGDVSSNVDLVGTLAAQVMGYAVNSAVLNAKESLGYLSHNDLNA